MHNNNHRALLIAKGEEGEKKNKKKKKTFREKKKLALEVKSLKVLRNIHEAAADGLRMLMRRSAAKSFSTDEENDGGGRRRLWPSVFRLDATPPTVKHQNVLRFLYVTLYRVGGRPTNETPFKFAILCEIRFNICTCCPVSDEEMTKVQPLLLLPAPACAKTCGPGNWPFLTSQRALVPLTS